MLTLLSMLDDDGESDNFLELYKHYERLALWIAKGILQDEQLAEDAVQEAFVRIAKNYAKISKQNPIKSNRTKNYIVVIVERAAIDVYRKRKKTLEQETFSDVIEETAYAKEADSQLEDSKIYEAIRSLPKSYSEVLLLHYVSGFSCREIATSLNINENTVRTNLTRGKQQLEIILSDLLLFKEPKKEDKE